MRRVAFLVLIVCVSLFAQNHGAGSKPASRLSDSFSKAGVKALFSMQRWRAKGDKAAEDKAEEALDEARTEHNPDNAAEAQMFSNLVSLSVNHTIVLLRREANLAEAEVTGADGTEANDPLTDENRCVDDENRCVDMLETAFRKRTTTKLPKECGGQQKQ